MKYIKEIITKYIRTFTSKEIYPKLGRWNVQHDISMIHFNIDQANTDHSCCILHDFQKQKRKINIFHIIYEKYKCKY
jgi:hypothetical protein